MTAHSLLIDLTMTVSVVVLLICMDSVEAVLFFQTLKGQFLIVCHRYQLAETAEVCNCHTLQSVVTCMDSVAPGLESLVITCMCRQVMGKQPRSLFQLVAYLQYFIYYIENRLIVTFVFKLQFVVYIQAVGSLYVHECIPFVASYEAKSVWRSLPLSVGSSPKVLQKIVLRTCTAVEDIDDDIGSTATADLHRERSAQSDGVDHVLYFG